jgi:hypothetical protein
MPRRKRTRKKKQRGGVRFRNILTAENVHRFDRQVEGLDVFIKIIPMPWMDNDETTLITPLPEFDTKNINDLARSNSGFIGHRASFDYYSYYTYPDFTGDDDFPVVCALFPPIGRTMWYPGYRNQEDLENVAEDFIYQDPDFEDHIYLLRIPRNTQEVIDTLHGDRSHGLDYLIEVVHGYDTTAQISRRARGAPSRQRARRRLAFAKSLHSRLGENSVMGDLDPETYSKIESLMQRGGMRISDIITVENRGDHIGENIEIVPIRPFNDNLTDVTGGDTIENFMSNQSSIVLTDDPDLFRHFGNNIVSVNLDIHEDSGLGDSFALKIPRNLRELEADLNSENPEYVYYVRLGNQGHPIHEEEARKKLLIELQEDEVDDNPDSPTLPNEYQKARQSLIKLQSRARGKKTRKKMKGLSSRRGIWKSPKNNREKMRRWIYETQYAREDDPIRGYEQYRIYDPIRGFRPEIDKPEPLDEEFIKRYNRMKNL